MKVKRLWSSRWVFEAVAIGLAISAAANLGHASSISAAQIKTDTHHDISLPLWSLAPASAKAKSSPISVWPKSTRVIVGAKSLSTIGGLNFDGVGASAGWYTADSSAAVGASQYVQSVNTNFAVFNKTTGAIEIGPLAESTLFSGFGGPCQTANQGDPNTEYDKAAGRWIISHHTQGPPFYECVAVSTNSDATGTYYRYAFQLPGNYFPDYPMVGVWPDGYYISFNLQDQTKNYRAVGSLLCALNRAAMLSGTPASMICFQVQGSGHDLTLLPSDLDGSNPPPLHTPEFFLGLGNNALNLYGFHVDFSTPSNSWFLGPRSIPVAAFTDACNGGVCVPQLDATQPVDSIGERLMARLSYRNPKSQNYDLLLVTHSVMSGTHAGIRWYEIHNPAGTPTVYQQGTYSPDSNFRWVGSMAMDKTGDIAVGYNVSSAAMHPAMRYTGRVPGDALGTMEAETSIIEGTGSQVAPNSFWTDVSSMSIDPVDDCTFWFSSQYYSSDSSTSWRTRIGSFKFASCQ